MMLRNSSFVGIIIIIVTIIITFTSSSILLLRLQRRNENVLLNKLCDNTNVTNKSMEALELGIIIIIIAIITIILLMIIVSSQNFSRYKHLLLYGVHVCIQRGMEALSRFVSSYQC